MSVILGHAKGLLEKLKEETGFNTVVQAPRDYKLIILCKMLRFGSFGGVAIVNAKYLRLIGFKEDMIGFFFTMTMLGDLFISFVLSLIADRVGRRKMMMISSTILASTALCFFVTENHLALLLFSIFGFMTPSGNEVGPFRSIEQSTIAHLVPLEQRADCYAFYAFLGTLSTAIGSFTSGMVLQVAQIWVSEKNSYKIVYFNLTIAACAIFQIASNLSEAVELDLNIEESVELLDDDDSDSSSTKNQTDSTTKPASATEANGFMSKSIKAVKGLVPQIGDAKVIVVKLGLLFMIDTAAKSLVTKTWVSYYLRQKFDLKASELGIVFFFHDLFVSSATLIGPSISRRKGIIFTMVATHIPSSIFNTLIPVPSHVIPTVIMVWGRGCFQAMDLSSKHAFVASIVKPEQRTAVIACMNLCRTVGQAASPTITGILTSHNKQWISFVLSGVLRVVYDVGLFLNFWHVRHTL